MKKGNNKRAMAILLVMIGLVLLIVGLIMYLGKDNDEDIVKDKNNDGNSGTDIVDDKKDWEDAVTNDFKISGFIQVDGSVSYMIYMGDNYEDVIYLRASEYNLASCLYDYSDDIRLRVTYSSKNQTIYDCKVINYLTGEVIDNPSDDNINKLFNIEYEREVIEKEWTDTIMLSELNENVIYKYTAFKDTDNLPKIENDTNSDCLVYIKDIGEDTYEKEINMYNVIDSSAISFSYADVSSGDTYSIMYKKITNEELLKLIDKEDIIYLSNYKSGDTLSYSFEKYIYNDTDKSIILNTKHNSFGKENVNTVTIEAGKIYGFDWKIDSVVIEY